jgi:copper chaperone
MTTTTAYHVTGMSCQHCVHAVTEELASAGGVSSVEVALVPGGESVVTVTSDRPLAEQAFAAALEEAGDYHMAARQPADPGEAGGGIRGDHAGEGKESR